MPTSVYDGRRHVYDEPYKALPWIQKFSDVKTCFLQQLTRERHLSSYNPLARTARTPRLVFSVRGLGAN